MAFPNDWLYHIPIFVDNTQGVDLVDYQIKIILNSSNFDFTKANTDGSDIRFTDNDKVTQLQYWIENWDSTNKNAVIWVKVPTVSNHSIKVIYMYYGNSNATSESNGESVFIFFDDFVDSTLSDDKWVTSGVDGYGAINYSISNSKLDVWGNNSWCILKMNRTFPPDATVIVEAAVYPSQKTPWHTMYFADNSGVSYNRFGIQDSNSGTWRIQYAVQGNYYYPKTLQNPLDYGHWFTLSLAKQSATSFMASVYEEGNFISSYSTNQLPWSSVTWTWVMWKYSTVHSTYDWIRVRQYTEKEPVVKVNTEQTLTTSPKEVIHNIEAEITGLDKVLLLNLGASSLLQPEQTNYFYSQKLMNPIVYIPFSNSVRNFTPVSVKTDSEHVDFIPDKDGRLTEAANFFGETGQYVSVVTDFNLGSLVFWFFTTRSNIDVCQMYNDSTLENSIYVNESGQLTVNATPTIKINDGQWHSLILTPSKLFVDGQHSFNVGLTSVFNRLVFGPDNGHGLLIGRIDELRVYCHEVSLLEAKVLHSDLKLNWQPPEIKIIEEKPGNIDYPSAEVTNLFDLKNITATPVILYKYREVDAVIIEQVQ